MNSEITATGYHVFAGGFTQGVERVMLVDQQIEVHDLGRQTVNVRHNMYHGPGVVNPGVRFLYGNPRCTGFSCVTCGMSEASRDKPTIDARQFVEMGLTTPGLDVFAWESVQEAFKSPLIQQFETRCLEEGWSVAHVMCNAANWGNAQHRKRYFFVGTKIEIEWEAPPICERHATIRDVIERFEDLKAPLISHATKEQLDEGDYVQSTTGFDHEYFEMLKPGWNMNKLYLHHPDKLLDHPNRYLSDIATFANSNMPYGMHCERRLKYDTAAPVVYSGSDRWIHPTKDRFLTIRELAEIMGWQWAPVGPDPIFQIGKGIVPQVGEWLAKNVERALRNNKAISIPYRAEFNFSKLAPERPKP